MDTFGSIPIAHSSTDGIYFVLLMDFMIRPIPAYSMVLLVFLPLDFIVSLPILPFPTQT